MIAYQTDRYKVSSHPRGDNSTIVRGNQEEREETAGLSAFGVGRHTVNRHSGEEPAPYTDTGQESREVGWGPLATLTLRDDCPGPTACCGCQPRGNLSIMCSHEDHERYRPPGQGPRRAQALRPRAASGNEARPVEARPRVGGIRGHAGDARRDRRGHRGRVYCRGGFFGRPDIGLAGAASRSRGGQGPAGTRAPLPDAAHRFTLALPAAGMAGPVRQLPLGHPRKGRRPTCLFADRPRSRKGAGLHEHPRRHQGGGSRRCPEGGRRRLPRRQGPLLPFGAREPAVVRGPCATPSAPT